MSKKVRILRKKATQIRASQIRVSQIRASQIRASQIRATEISSNHRSSMELFFFFCFLCTQEVTNPKASQWLLYKLLAISKGHQLESKMSMEPLSMNVVSTVGMWSCAGAGFRRRVHLLDLRREERDRRAARDARGAARDLRGAARCALLRCELYGFSHATPCATELLHQAAGCKNYVTHKTQI